MTTYLSVNEEVVETRLSCGQGRLPAVEVVVKMLLISMRLPVSSTSPLRLREAALADNED